MIGRIIIVNSRGVWEKKGEIFVRIGDVPANPNRGRIRRVLAGFGAFFGFVAFIAMVWMALGIACISMYPKGVCGF